MLWAISAACACCYADGAAPYRWPNPGAGGLAACEPLAAWRASAPFSLGGPGRGLVEVEGVEVRLLGAPGGVEDEADGLQALANRHANEAGAVVGDL